MGLLRLSASTWTIHKMDIQAIEKEAEYPIGHDFFRIDHGTNYFSFFERLGSLQYYGWIEDQKIVAVAAAVLRKLETSGQYSKAWYLCDLKVHPKYRGRQIPLRLLAKALPMNYLRCQRGYAISMNAEGERSNRVAKLLARFRWLRFSETAKILIWSMNASEIERALPLIRIHRGPVTFLSLGGIKDLVLRSTGLPLDLVHVQFGPMGVRGETQPLDGFVHMFCAPENDELALEIKMKLNMSPTATATVISHRMMKSDWRWVLTSDI